VVGASWAPLVSEPDIGRLTPEQTVNLQAVSYTTTPARGDRIGTITLPTLDLNWPIYEGTTEAELSQGVGHFIDSVLPGIRDNTVLSGHRTTVFGRLGELAEGDLIHVGTSAGEFTYQVREFRIVPRTSLDVIVPTTTAVLTITTCYPFYSLIKTTEAFIVSADLVASQLTPE
jgi:sortase A